MTPTAPRDEGSMADTVRKKKLRPHRSSGVLLHPSSLPGPYGIGDLGPAAYAWVDALRRARQTWWQILPLGPTGFGDSPYQCFSAFAGNPGLVSPELLARDGLLRPDDLPPPPGFPADRVDYGAALPYKTALLDRAWERFRDSAPTPLRAEYDEFVAARADWLDDYALFMAVKDSLGGATWQDWPAPLRGRRPEALQAARAELGDRVGRHSFRQFLF